MTLYKKIIVGIFAFFISCDLLHSGGTLSKAKDVSTISTVPTLPKQNLVDAKLVSLYGPVVATGVCCSLVLLKLKKSKMQRNLEEAQREADYKEILKNLSDHKEKFVVVENKLAALEELIKQQGDDIHNLGTKPPRKLSNRICSLIENSQTVLPKEETVLRQELDSPVEHSSELEERPFSS